MTKANIPRDFPVSNILLFTNRKGLKKKSFTFDRIQSMIILFFNTDGELLTCRQEKDHAYLQIIVTSL